MAIFTIDGNFFAQRIRNAADLKFIQNPEKDKAALIKACTESLATQVSNISSALDGIVICRDWSSWRKQFQQTYPLESVKSEEKQTYKSNRDGEKDYDAAKFYAAYDEWCQLLEDKLSIPVLRFKGAEADDIVYIVSLIMKKKGKQSICFSSDGDFYQLVNESTCLVKMPKYELFLHRGQEQINEKKDLSSIFGKKPSKFDFAVNSFDKESVRRINPMKSLFMKVISGDPKDNVPPVFHWKSSTGTKQFKPANGHIEKSLAKMSLNLDDIDETFLYDKTLMLQFIENLLIITKQTRDIEHTYKVYLSNLKMKHLSVKQIPEQVLRGVVEVWNEKSKLEQNIKTCSNGHDMLNAIGHSKASSDYFNQFDLGQVTNDSNL